MSWFVSLISFQHYRWCCYRSFDMSLESFFFFLSLFFSLFIINYVCLCLILERIGVSICLQNFLFYFFLSLFFFFFYCKLYPFIFNLGKSGVWYLWLASHEYHMQLSKLFYFLKYFLYCVILSNFFKSAKKNKDSNIILSFSFPIRSWIAWKMETSMNQ